MADLFTIPRVHQYFREPQVPNEFRTDYQFCKIWPDRRIRRWLAFRSSSRLAARGKRRLL